MAPEINHSVKQYDVVVIGAGICGLNALFVAAQYLRPGQRIALVDRRDRAGGMWVDTYDYVRLHQAHPYFTAGNIKWEWDKDPSYLATKPEVLDHLQHCLDTISDRVTVDTYFGWVYEEHAEHDGRVLTMVERAGERIVLDSRRLVKALGFNIERNQPLELSSQRVRSVSPDFCDVRHGEIAESDAPVWVIGGGKAAMDTVHALVSDSPGREVNLIAGSGTYFVRRDEVYPERRWGRGTRVNKAVETLASGYDGHDETRFLAANLGDLTTKVTQTAENFMVGVISDAEVDTIKRGLTWMMTDHLVDVVDDGPDPGDGAEIVLRKGDTIPVPAGTWIVNCTGYLLKQEHPYEPYSSPSGNVLSINQRSVTFAFTTFAGYLMTHLLMRGKLATAPLWEIDWLDLRRRTGGRGSAAALTIFMHNYTVLVDTLPARVILSNGLDSDRWYSPPRRLAGALSFVRRHNRLRTDYQRTLTTVRETYGVRCGPLRHDERRTSTGASSSSAAAAAYNQP